MKKNLTSTTTLLIAYLAWMSVELASATTTIEPMGKAVAAILGTPKATAKKLNIGDSKIAVGHSEGAVTVYYSKATGKYAFVEKGVFNPDCGHTWAIGINGIFGEGDSKFAPSTRTARSTLLLRSLRPSSISSKAKARLTSLHSTAASRTFPRPRERACSPPMQ